MIDELIFKYRKNIHNDVTFLIRNHMKANHPRLFFLFALLFIATIFSYIIFLCFASLISFVVMLAFAISVGVFINTYDDKHGLSFENRQNTLNAVRKLLKTSIKGFDYSSGASISKIIEFLSSYIKAKPLFYTISKATNSFIVIIVIPLLRFFIEPYLKEFIDIDFNQTAVVFLIIILLIALVGILYY
ncbi:MAG: hypothetical protein J5968_06830, partial [Oscillospiraceae bacterium]|nr:hypothetical protein [Oscillospiraceae bacterium]